MATLCLGTAAKHVLRVKAAIDYAAEVTCLIDIRESDSAAVLAEQLPMGAFLTEQGSQNLPRWVKRADSEMDTAYLKRAVTLATAEKPETGRLFQAIHGNTEHWHTVPDAGLMPLPAPATQATAEAGGGLGVDGRGDGTDGEAKGASRQRERRKRSTRGKPTAPLSLPLSLWRAAGLCARR